MASNKSTKLLFLLFTSISVFGQSNYNDFQGRKTQIFYDDFYDNSNYWSTGNYAGESKGSVYDGHYYWESTISSAMTTSREIIINTDKDFEIEGRFKRVSGVKATTLQSMIFGNDGTKKYYFGFTADGSYRISWYDGSQYNAIKDWTDSSSISKYGYNLMTVRKVGSRMYFFINRTFVYSTYARDFYGNKIGFQTASKTKIKIDYLKVNYLKKTGKSYNHYSYSDKNFIVQESFNNNNRSWSTGTSGKSEGYTQDGAYFWKSKNSSAWTSNLTFDLNQSRDFEIEAKIRYVSGSKTSGIMLQWGRDIDTGSNFNFEFNGNGKYWIGKYNNNNYVASKSWTYDSKVYTSSYNKMTIRKIGDKYYFFINEKYLHSMNFTSFYGNRIGFTTPSNTSIAIAYLNIAYLDEDNKRKESNTDGEERAPGGN